MRARDKAIIADLDRFRCLSRDDIIALHFSTVKDGVKACNDVMRRLRDRHEVEVIASDPQYVYACKPSPIRKGSQKIPHYLRIAEVYRELRKLGGEPRLFIPEPKYGKGRPEPDVFTVWHGRAFYIEVQRSVFTAKVWTEKFRRYAEWYECGEWRNESWQPAEKKVFPYVWVISGSRVPVPEKLPFPVLQSRTIAELFGK